MIFSSGIQSFKSLRNNGCKYIDKTKYIFTLITSGKYFYMCRPRRFGKSLTLSTMEHIFKGDKHLFQNLWIENKWNWDQTYPVIRLDFSNIRENTNGLEKALCFRLNEIAKDYNVDLALGCSNDLFDELIKKLKQKYTEVVILIDEYDKPLLDYLESDKHQRALENREILRNFYSIIKGNDEYIKFFFFTGIAKFPKLSLFSTLNNLVNIDQYEFLRNIVGYSEKELLKEYKKELRQSFKKMQQQFNSFEEYMNALRYWYNGYNFLGKEKVYNPFSLMLFLSSGERFMSHWMSSGVSTFLFHLMRKEKHFIFKEFEADLESIDMFNIENVKLSTVLYQAGYLTIKSIDSFNNAVFNYPNKEVEITLSKQIIEDFYQFESKLNYVPIKKASLAFENHNIVDAMEEFQNMISTLPFHLFENAETQKSNYEKPYHTIFHLLFTCVGTYVRSEVSNFRGRADCIIEATKANYIVEFKVDQSTQTALQQIKEKEYFKPYLLNPTKTLYLIGLNVISATKQVEWSMEEYKSPLNINL